MAWNCVIEHRPVKHARLRVDDTLTVRLIVPEAFTHTEIDNILKRRDFWIRKHISRFESAKKAISLRVGQVLFLGDPYRYVFDRSANNKTIINYDYRTIRTGLDLTDAETLRRWYRRQARKHIVERVRILADKNKMFFKKLFIRNQKTKWGNCSSIKNLSFNWKLIKTPQYVIDYLITHELTHTEIMDHSQKFWLKVKILCPEYKKATEWLTKYGRAL